MNKTFTFHYLLDTSENLNELISFDFDDEVLEINKLINEIEYSPSERCIQEIINYANN